MAVLRLAGRVKLHESWHFEVSGVIWRLFPTSSGHLLGEERDLSEKNTSFFCLDQVTGKVMWQKAAFGERWWIGIEAVHRDMFFLHKFATPDLPEHKSIIAADLLKGTRVWSNEEAKFIAVRDESVFAALNAWQGRSIIELHYRTGALLRTLDIEEEIVGDRVIKGTSPVSDSLYFPASVTNLASDSSLAVLAIQKHCRGKDIVGAVEYLDYDDRLVIFNYHERLSPRSSESPTLKNTLKVIEKDSGRVLFDEVLNPSAAAVVPDSFFVQHHTLYYVTDRRRLTAVPLT